MIIGIHSTTRRMRQQCRGMALTSARRLADLMKLPLVNRSGTTGEDVAQIWRQYHDKIPDAMARQMEPWRMERVMSNARSNPIFMFPVFRGKGFFSMVSQFQMNTCMMTTMEQFQKPGATPSLIITFYDELCLTKQVGLVRADIASLVTKTEAGQLIDRLVYYYSSAEQHLIRTFNQRPREFDLDGYIRESRSRATRS